MLGMNWEQDVHEPCTVDKEKSHRLYLYQVTVERAIAEGHDAKWIRDEVDRLAKSTKPDFRF